VKSHTLRRFVYVVISIATLVLLLTVLPASPALAFPDVPAGHLYEAAINDLSARSIISGYKNGDFGLTDPVRRMQFAKMIDGTLGIVPATSTDTRFTDLGDPDPEAHGYPHTYVQPAFDYGITYGTNAAQTLFSPKSNIHRDQVVSMIVRGVQGMFPAALEEELDNFESLFDTVPKPHGSNLRIAEYNGLLDGLIGLGPGWKVAADATRGEVAQMLHNVLLLLAAAEPSSGDLMHAWFAPGGSWQDWQRENVSQITGAGAIRWGIGGLNSHEPFAGSQYEHVWAVSDHGHLLMFKVSTGGHQWQATDISAQTGNCVASVCDGDVQVIGAVLHLAARSFAGDLLHFSWQPGQSWQCENVSLKVGAKIAYRPTLFSDAAAPPGTMTVGAAGTNGHLLLFHFSGSSWTVEDVTDDTTITCGGFVRWQPLGTVDTDGHLWVLKRASATSPWEATGVSSVGFDFALGERVLGWNFQQWPWMDQYGHYGLVTESNDLLHVWADAAGAWHAENLTAAVGRKISSLCSWWTLGTGPSSGILCIFAVTPDRKLLGIWRTLPAGNWQVFNASSELGFSVYPWAIPAPSYSMGIQHLMFVRGE